MISSRASFAVVALLALTGCDQPKGHSFTAGQRGRYVGVGHFPPGPMWSQIMRGAQADGPRAKPSDDEQIIVVMDSQTGQVRQCGNLTGHCIGLDPWAKALGPGETAPLQVTKHAEQLEVH